VKIDAALLLLLDLFDSSVSSVESPCTAVCVISKSPSIFLLNYLTLNSDLDSLRLFEEIVSS